MGTVTSTQGGVTKTYQLPDMDGLKLFPQSSDWDPEQLVYEADWRARSGVIDGWHWSTDTFTALVERATLPDIETDGATGRQVLKLFGAPLVPQWSIKLEHLAVLGGTGDLPHLGRFDLERLWFAAFWVAGAPEPLTEGVRVHASARTDRGMVRITPDVSTSSRKALVMGVTPSADVWVPRIDLPMHDLGARA